MTAIRRNPAPGPTWRSTLALASGPILCLLVCLVPGGGMDAGARRTAGVALWMAIWWATETVPLAVTGLLPLVLFPVLGVRGVRELAPRYGDHMVFLFLGGFALALAVEKAGLHRRLALRVVATTGGSARGLVWGFLLSAAALSMWLSNTATTLMMLPIAAGAASRLESSVAPARVFLAVAYGASIGGIGTLVGTPPNVVLAGMAPRLAPDAAPITFAGWLLVGMPVVLLLLPTAGIILGRGLPHHAPKGLQQTIARERRHLGSLTARELRAGLLFVCTALAWIMRAPMQIGPWRVPGWADFVADPRLVSDSVPAIAALVLATLLPAGNDTRSPLLTWDDIRHGVPWGVLLLFGGGFALADAVHVSGLDTWLTSAFDGLAGMPRPILILGVCLTAMAATELTSNTATATLLLPVMAALARSTDSPPYLLMVPAVVSSSCAFMLPAATPPNAVAVGSGYVSARELFRNGVQLNAAAALVVTAVVALFGPWLLP